MSWYNGKTQVTDNSDLLAENAQLRADLTLHREALRVLLSWYGPDGGCVLGYWSQKLCMGEDCADCNNTDQRITDAALTEAAKRLGKEQGNATTKADIFRVALEIQFERDKAMYYGRRWKHQRDRFLRVAKALRKRAEKAEAELATLQAEHTRLLDCHESLTYRHADLEVSFEDMKAERDAALWEIVILERMFRDGVSDKICDTINCSDALCGDDVCTAAHRERAERELEGK